MEHLHGSANRTQPATQWPPLTLTHGHTENCIGICMSREPKLQLQLELELKMLLLPLLWLGNDFEVATHIGQGVLKNSFHCPALSG